MYTTSTFTTLYASCLSYNWGAIFSPSFNIKQSSNFNLEQNLRDKHLLLLSYPFGLIKFVKSRRLTDLMKYEVLTLQWRLSFLPLSPSSLLQMRRPRQNKDSLALKNLDV